MTWTPIHAKVQQTLRQRDLLRRGQAVVLGFSGGQDSLCLLQILRDLQPKWSWRLAISHCNHRWPLDSDRNAEHVADLANRWSLEFYPLISSTVLKGEAEGRIWRYQVLTELAHQQGFNAVLTAHTASDRAETLLYNLLRGSGMDGLQALAWQRPLSESVQLIRPLLEITRAQTGAFCDEMNLPIWQDTMNQDLAYRRNRIRLELLPWLHHNFNPQVETTLAKTAEILLAETDFLNRQALDLWEQSRRPRPDFNGVLAALDQSILQESPLALQRRVLRHWLQIHLNIKPNYEQIEKAVALIYGHTGERSDPFIAGIVAEVHRPLLCLVKLNHSHL